MDLLKNKTELFIDPKELLKYKSEDLKDYLIIPTRDKIFICSKKPYALSFEGWDIYDAEMKRKYPIRMWIKNKWHNIYYSLLRFKNNIYYGIYYRLIKNWAVVDSGLPRGYHDKPELMLHVNFQLLKDFVEKEKTDNIDWSSDGDSKAWAEIQSLYNWWTRDFKERESIEESIHLKVEANMEKGIKSFDAPNMEYYKELNELEKQWNNENNENLIRLMRVREFLWT